MKQRKLLSSTLMQLVMIFEKSFPDLKQMAIANPEIKDFTTTFAQWIAAKEESDARKFFERLIENEGVTIHE